jgi:hypothetical protein
MRKNYLALFKFSTAALLSASVKTFTFGQIPTTQTFAFTDAL